VLGVLAKKHRRAADHPQDADRPDVYFQSEAAREEREKMRGIKPELTGIKNGIIKPTRSDMNT
jgi:hypothetical protein